MADLNENGKVVIVFQGLEIEFSPEQLIPVPEKILVLSIPGAPLLVGRFEMEFQFLAYMLGIFNRETRQRDWHTIFHKFDLDGNHVQTDFWVPEADVITYADQIDAVCAKRDQWVASLNSMEPQDIEIKPFLTTIGNSEIGLIDETPDYGWPVVCLSPANISFRPPWDGNYE